VIRNLDFKVTIFFNVKYLENGTDMQRILQQTARKSYELLNNDIFNDTKVSSAGHCSTLNLMNGIDGHILIELTHALLNSIISEDLQ